MKLSNLRLTVSLKRLPFAYILLIFTILFGNNPLKAQNSLGESKLDASTFFAQTKQLTQFFRRFNGEEDAKGNKLDSNNFQFREKHLRKNFLSILFDKQNHSITENLKNDFVNEVLEEKNPKFLDFHTGNWFAEVNAVFSYQNHPVNLLIYLQIEKSGLGYKWVISNVYFDSFSELFSHPNTSDKAASFLHPMSHEIDFMNLRKAFNDPKDIDYYAPNDYTPDYLTLFFVELKGGHLTYKTINSVKFHFLQVNGWYFEVNDFNRSGFNSGWLISNLLKVNEEEKARLLKIYDHD
ncbi:MAG: hypothetical protein HXX14_06065 [Bacteroidetes bacterium]|nr:hypothetical protein [Bacteroidota bacterium]